MRGDVLGGAAPHQLHRDGRLAGTIGQLREVLGDDADELIGIAHELRDLLGGDADRAERFDVLLATARGGDCGLFQLLEAPAMRSIEERQRRQP
jgi:hypothetical protein